MAKLTILSVIIGLALWGFPQWQEKQTQQQILAATVQIKMVVPQLTETESDEVEPLPIPPDEYRPISRPENYVEADGLGTVVQVNGRSLLITHDHWSQLTSDLGDVQFRDAVGTLLAKLDLYRFKQLILSRNGGTMVLSAPDAIQHLAAVIADEGVTNRDEFWLVHRQEERLVVSAVRRVGTELKNDVTVWRLKGQPVAGGDSGGGVWVNGRLIATTWAAITIDNTVTYERKTTDLSLAALLESTP